MKRRNQLIGGACVVGVVIALVVFVIVRNARQEPLTPDPMRAGLHAAAASGKKGDRGGLDSIISQTERRDLRVSEALLPDFASFLRDSDPQVQLLGVTGLRVLASPKGVKPLMEYLDSVDTSIFRPKPEAHDAPVTEIQAKRFLWTWQAVGIAAAALGELGDPSAISAIEHVKDCPPFENWDPVREALAKLGAVKSFASVPPDATDQESARASRAMSRIRDPKKVPDLMGVVRDTKASETLRAGAITALGEMNTPGVAEFLASVLRDSSYPRRVRNSASVAAGKTRNPIVEEPLLRLAGDSDPHIRVRALIGLVVFDPQKYAGRWFDTIMDPRESTDYRVELLMYTDYVPVEVLREQKQQFYRCLDAQNANGQPDDRVRATVWDCIDRVFWEQPPITFSSEESPFVSRIKSAVRMTFVRQGYKRNQRLEEKVDERVRQIVSFSSPSSEVQK